MKCGHQWGRESRGPFSILQAWFGGHLRDSFCKFWKKGFSEPLPITAVQWFICHKTDSCTAYSKANTQPAACRKPGYINTMLLTEPALFSKFNKMWQSRNLTQKKTTAKWTRRIYKQPLVIVTFASFASHCIYYKGTYCQIPGRVAEWIERPLLML